MQPASYARNLANTTNRIMFTKSKQLFVFAVIDQQHEHHYEYVRAPAAQSIPVLLDVYVWTNMYVLV